MTEQEIYLALTGVFRDVFEDETLTVTEWTAADQIRGWDSLATVNIIVAAETLFDVRFRSAEVDTLRNVGDLVGMIRKKMAAPSTRC